MDRLPSSRLSYKDYFKIGLVVVGLSTTTACESAPTTPSSTVDLPTPIPTLVIPNTPTPVTESADIKKLTVPLPLGCKLITDVKEATNILSRGFTPFIDEKSDYAQESERNIKSGYPTAASPYLDKLREKGQITEPENARLLIQALEKNSAVSKAAAAKFSGDASNQLNGQADCSQAQANSLKETYKLEN